MHLPLLFYCVGREGDQRSQTIAEMIRSVDSSQFDEPDEEGGRNQKIFSWFVTIHAIVLSNICVTIHINLIV